MNYFLYQLRFETPVHFGTSDSALSLFSAEDHFRADTLFSALCHTALQLQGAAGLEKLLGLAQRGELLLSDAMPWQGERFFLPKPAFAAQAVVEIPAEKRKAVKRLNWIPAEKFGQYCTCVKSGELFESEEVSFGAAAEVTKASVPGIGDAVPYSVGLYGFRENCGLYILVAHSSMENETWLLELLKVLGHTGIGGKVSAGYGKYSMIDNIYLNDPFDAQTEWLYHALSEEGTASMLLTTSLPRDEELDVVLDGAFYQLIRRGGFVASDTYSETPQKKQTQYYLNAGAVLKHRFSGDVYEVGGFGGHPVYRYSKPIFLGVEL